MYRIGAMAIVRSGGLGRTTLDGLCANLVGIVLARFAYPPLIPALMAAHWSFPAEAVYLGAANLAGYLAGALLARGMTARFPITVVLRAMMLLATIAFFACALPLSFLWFSIWRFAAGLAGGALFVLPAPTGLTPVPLLPRGGGGGGTFPRGGLGLSPPGQMVLRLLRPGFIAHPGGVVAVFFLVA